GLAVPASGGTVELVPRLAQSRDLDLHRKDPVGAAQAHRDAAALFAEAHTEHGPAVAFGGGVDRRDRRPRGARELDGEDAAVAIGLDPDRGLSADARQVVSPVENVEGFI